MAGHTPGPWHWDTEGIDDSEETVVCAGDYYIATCHRCVPESLESYHANARLKAAADAEAAGTTEQSA